ncbi:MAG: porin family protein [Vicinamibacterales bacterium]
MTVRLRLLVALGILAMLPVAAAAQSKTTFGVKAGVNLANISSPDQETSNRPGLVGGVVVGRQINDRFGVQVEGLYSQQGAKDTTPGSGIENLKYRVNYFSVPVLVRFGNTTTGETHLHLFTGPQAGFKLNAKATGNIGSVKLDEDINDLIKSTDFGWVIGASVERHRLFFDARYTHGLTNFAKTAGDEGKNRTISLTAGIRLK